MVGYLLMLMAVRSSSSALSLANARERNKGRKRERECVLYYCVCSTYVRMATIIREYSHGHLTLEFICVRLFCFALPFWSNTCNNIQILQLKIACLQNPYFYFVCKKIVFFHLGQYAS